MNCHRVQSLISAYVDSELSGVEMLAIREHLNGCSECRREFESLREVKSALGRLHTKHPVADLASRICLQLDIAEARKQEQKPLVPSLSDIWHKHLETFPARLRWATAGVCILAALMVLGGGKMTLIESPPQVNMVTTVGLNEGAPAPLPDLSTFRSADKPSWRFWGESQPTPRPIVESGGLAFAGYTSFAAP